jgi:hypothetical protein
MKGRIIFTLVALVAVLAFGNFGSTQAESVLQAYDAEIRTSDIKISRTMSSGKTYYVTVRVRNNGDIRWSGRGFSLSSKIYRGPSGSPTQRDELTPEVDLKSVVETTEYYKFDYKVEAPNYKGQYILEWTMMKNSRPFGDKTRATIKVTE